MRDKLLQALPQSNYPEEYFISRIRGGRSRLIKDWNALLYSRDLREFLRASNHEFFDSSFLKPLLKRHRWLYSEMNDRLRDIFWPYFWLHEIRTLVTSLRYINKGYKETAEGLLRVSLLSKEIKECIFSPGDFDKAVKKLIDFFTLLYKGFIDGYDIFYKKGLQGFERFIHETFIKYLLSLELHREIRAFIIYQIDRRNIIALYKLIKWDIRTPAEFLSGGEIELRELERVLIKRDFQLFSSLLKSLTGLSGDNIEDILLRGLSIRLRKKSYDGSTGLILYYLWSLYLEMRNLGTLLSATGMERAELKEEII